MVCKFLSAQTGVCISDAIPCMDYGRSKGAKAGHRQLGQLLPQLRCLLDAVNSLRNNCEGKRCQVTALHAE